MSILENAPMKIFQNGILTKCYDSVDLNFIQSIDKNVYFLVNGGWIPAAIFGSKNTTLFLDRNITSIIRHANLSKESDLTDWIMQLNNSSFDLKLFFHLIEGKLKRFPKREDVMNDLIESVRAIHKIFPKMVSNDYSGDLEAIKDYFENNLELEIEWLKLFNEVNIILATRPARERRIDLWSKIRILCKKYRADVIIELIFLSIVYEPEGFDCFGKRIQVGRRIFKPGKNHDPYNFLCDLRQIRMFSFLNPYYSNRSTAIVTSDVGLAATWIYLGMSNDIGDDETSFQVDLKAFYEIDCSEVKNAIDQILEK